MLIAEPLEGGEAGGQLSEGWGRAYRARVHGAEDAPQVGSSETHPDVPQQVSVGSVHSPAPEQVPGQPEPHSMVF